MIEADLDVVPEIERIAHGGPAEGRAILAERLTVFPDGCFSLVRDGAILGYALSHPWRSADPPALHRTLGALPARPGCFYLHDLALLPEARGGGAAREVLSRVAALAHALHLATIELVALGGTQPFWRHHGFVEVAGALPAEKQQAYGLGACLMRRTA